MKQAEKINTIKRNLKDGLLVSHKPIDDHYMLADLKTKLELFDFALDGLMETASNSVIEPRNLIHLQLYWINLSVSLGRALSLLEYLNGALDLDGVEFEDQHYHDFPINGVKQAVDEYREKHNR